jgi:hypothetical protein
VDSNHSRKDLIYSQVAVSERLLLSNCTSCSLRYSIVRTIIVPRSGIEPLPIACKTITLPLRQRGYSSVFPECQYIFGLSFIVTNYSTTSQQILMYKTCSYRVMVLSHSRVRYEPSLVPDHSVFWWT